MLRRGSHGFPARESCENAGAKDKRHPLDFIWLLILRDMFEELDLSWDDEMNVSPASERLLERLTNPLWRSPVPKGSVKHSDSRTSLMFSLAATWMLIMPLSTSISGFGMSVKS